MLDDFLREEDQEEKSSAFLDEIEGDDLFEYPSDADYGFLGMTPFQRFIVSLLLLGLVVISGAFCLLITGAISIPAG